MPVLEATGRNIRTLEELVDRLGGIPLSRIAAWPPPGSAVEEDLFVPREDGSDHLFELVDGTLVEKAMSAWESRLALILGYFLESFLDDHPLGIALGADAMLRLMPGLIRLPDVGFFCWDRFPDRRRPRSKVYAVAPDLAVEVISEGNTAAEMTRKVGEYFQTGSRMVWLVYPETQLVHVYRAPGEYSTLGIEEMLDGGDVLPGFQLSIRRWFERSWPGEQF